MADRLRDVPSGITGELRTYLSEVRSAVNAMPVMSFFSGLTPESVITGVAGNFAFNVGTSTSTQSLAFIKLGSPMTVSKVSWARLSIQTLA